MKVTVGSAKSPDLQFPHSLEVEAEADLVAMDQWSHY